uniref:NADH dehydrogenase subunit 6 n=1 Tax=Rhinotergum shaoguanense TaxID=1452699 RepID=A0A1S5XVX5_9ACAR|nr:NADH dehydrogenase subunit 6 [Rhinotergum shaoguanense]AQQ72855.1 NADH dehydrogenase subunit 6 [Rhinotergum shaoguanense]
MTIILMILSAMSLYLMIFSNNPVKAMMSLLMLSSITAIMMFNFSSMAWFPSIFYLLFMGGILMVFMIMSSIMPNEKMSKIKNIFLVTAVIMLITLNMAENAKIEELMFNSQLKWFMMCNQNILMATILIMVYFFMFIKQVSKEKSSLRSELCHSKKKFCKFLL